MTDNLSGPDNDQREPEDRRWPRDAKISLWAGFIMLAAVILLIILDSWLSWGAPGWEHPGILGDFWGGHLGGAAGLAGTFFFITALLLQRHELTLQRRELRLQNEYNARRFDFEYIGRLVTGAYESSAAQKRISAGDPDITPLMRAALLYHCKKHENQIAASGELLCFAISSFPPKNRNDWKMEVKKVVEMVGKQGPAEMQTRAQNWQPDAEKIIDTVIV
ncbi:MAG: hypothetical protein JSU63_17755 [Phycisphaerales bacterium]|nr:MAG: hypothetical protein JSU63_17755 [Phycisphaerales bacterium]